MCKYDVLTHAWTGNKKKKIRELERYGGGERPSGDEASLWFLCVCVCVSIRSVEQMPETKLGLV